MSFVDDSVYHDLLCKIGSLQNQLYTMGYKVKLPDKLIYTIGPDKHKMNQIKGYTFLNSSGEEVEIKFTLYSDKSVKIESNISLLNCTLILF